MKISPVLPIALSTLLTTTLAAPFALRYPSPAETEKRADTFLRPKGRLSSFADAIHNDLDLRSAESFLTKKDAVPTVEEKRASGSLGGVSTSSFSSAIHDDLDFGGTADPLVAGAGNSLALFKRAFNTVKRAVGSLTGGASTSSFSSAIHDDLDFGGSSDSAVGGESASLSLFKKTVGDATEKVAEPFNA